MDLELNGKVALVSGASRGIGAATARQLAAEGADIIVGYHANHSGADAVAHDVQQLGRRCWKFSADLTDASAVKDGLNGLVKRESIAALDALVLCAGKNIVTPLDQLTTAEWDHLIAVNLSGPFYLLQAARPWFRPGAAVVTVSSVAAHTGAPHHAHYAAAKAGLINLTKSAARALAPDVRVNCVAPGITLTEMGRDTVTHLADDYAQTKLLTGRFAEPDEIAKLIVFLVSPAAAFISGATFDANGGRDLR